MSARFRKKSRKDFMQLIINEYSKLHAGPINPDECYEYAMKNGLYKPPQKSIRQLFREEFSQAAREETYKDAQGREVRRKYPVVIRQGEKQLVFWEDVKKATKEHMRLSFAQKRKNMKYDVTKCRTEIESWNDNNPYGDKIQMSFNFDEDTKDDQHSEKYEDVLPEDLDLDSDKESEA